MATDVDKAKQTTYTTDDIMAAILELRNSTTKIQETNQAIQDSNTAIKESVAALEIRVKALELKPGNSAGLFTPPKQPAPSMS